VGATYGERIHFEVENGDRVLVVTTGHATISAVASEF